MAVYISELLCYIFGKYGKMPMDSIRSVIVSFYDGAEILAAKELLSKYVGELKLDGAPRCVSRRKSDDKAKVDAEDILGLVSFVDERRTIDSLPKFVAANLERVPPLQSDVLDLCLAVNRIAVLESKMEQLMLNYVQAQVPQVPVCVTRSTKPDATPPESLTATINVGTQLSSVNTAVSANTTPVTEVQCDDGVSSTWASVTNNAANSDGEWQAVVRQQRKEKPKPTVRVRGAKVDAGTVTAVP